MLFMRRYLAVGMSAAIMWLTVSCVLPSLWGDYGASDQGALDIDIDYTGTWYIDTFHYAREAPNIRHFVLVVPESEAERAGAGWFFTSLEVQPDGSLKVRGDRQEYAWALDYVYDAPEGRFSGHFAPGTYAVAVAFIAGPLSREEAGVGADVVLWPGVTGGGASTEFQTVEIAAGDTVTLTIEITDADGWACPWIYVANGTGFERRTEILRNRRGPDSAGTEITALEPVAAQDGAIVLRVAEEKDEVTLLDALILRVDGVAVFADMPELSADDGQTVILRRGESIDLRFPVPAGYAAGDAVSVVASGYYVPVE